MCLLNNHLAGTLVPHSCMYSENLISRKTVYLPDVFCAIVRLSGVGAVVGFPFPFLDAAPGVVWGSPSQHIDAIS